MNKNDIDYMNLIKILEEELLPAMGYMEPIAVAYCVAMARRTLGTTPDCVVMEANGNIIKNVRSVIVPNTGHLHGVPAAAAAGIVVGNADKQLKVTTPVTKGEQESVRVFMEQVPTAVSIASSPLIFDIVVTVYAGESCAKVRIANYHTNIVLVEKDREVLQSSEIKDDSESDMTDRSRLSVEKIYDSANTVDVEDIKKLLDVQIAYNMDISEEGLKNDYGVNIGSVLLKANKEVMDSCNESALRLKAGTMAVAGSDARMNGYELPTIVNSGSGNQGITTSALVIVHARTMGAGEEKLYRALALSSLLGTHQETPISRLSTYCSTINAGVTIGYGIAYLKGADLDGIIRTPVNALATVSGVVCNGVKASCVGKIALVVDNGISGYGMYQEGQQFVGGNGIVKKGVENMIVSIGRLGRDGMAETDKEILRIMVSD